MITHPDVQLKAQEELDNVIGRDRLPDIDDREALPYISALVKEVLRWYPILPFGFPHRLLVDDVYNGMHIPGGSIVFPNAWGMSRDMANYGPDPEAFRPERFLKSQIQDPFSYIFGFGRRICPGRYMAINTLFIAISAVLQVFTLSKPLNEDGTEKSVEPKWLNGLVTHLESFPASFKLRFEGADKLFNSEV